MDIFQNSSGGVGIKLAVRETSTSLQTRKEDRTILVDATSAAVAIYLGRNLDRGQEQVIVKTDSSTYAVTVVDPAGTTLATLTTQNEAVTVQRKVARNSWQVRRQRTGYGVGDGGAVTQATSKSTGVTLNTTTGAITLHNASLADATTVTFTVTDALCAADDVPSVVHKSAGTAGAYLVWAHSPAAGSFKISVRNVSGGSLGEAIVLQFAIVKGAVA